MSFGAGANPKSPAWPLNCIYLHWGGRWREAVGRWGRHGAENAKAMRRATGQGTLNRRAEEGGKKVWVVRGSTCKTLV